MKSRNHGFTLVELMIVIIIVLIGMTIAVWAIEKRASHFRLRGSTREMLAMMKLAQASAIRANGTYRIHRFDTASYGFEFRSTPNAAWTSPPSTEKKMSQTVLFQNPIKFTNLASAPCTVADCRTPQFRSDGTLNTGGTFSLTDSKETFTIEWSIGGAIRVQ